MANFLDDYRGPNAAPPDPRPSPLPLEGEIVLEPRQRNVFCTAKPNRLYRATRLRFDPLPRELVVRSVLVGPADQLLAPVPALVLHLENRGKDTIRLLGWFDGIYCP